jgi:hypothetical protein
MKSCISTKFFAVFSSCLIFVILTGCNPAPSGQLNTNPKPTVSITNSNTISKKSEQNSNNRTVIPSPQQNSSGTKVMSTEEFSPIFKNSPNLIAAESAYDALLDGQQITIKSFKIYDIGRNDVGTIYMRDIDFDEAKRPPLLVVFSESQKESLSSIKEGDIVNVKCKYRKFDQSIVALVFDFESF